MRKIKVPGQGERRLRISRPKSKFWHLHAHSNYSVNDALSPVEEMVRLAASQGQPALALTDHGNMGGCVQLYQHAKEAGIAPFPGIEAYLVHDFDQFKENYDGSQRFHVGLVAFTTDGYEALVRLVSKSHSRARFHHKPHVDFSDFAEWNQRGWTDGIALTTGCFFGMVQQTLMTDPDRAKRLIAALARMFPHLYVELQHHNIDHEGVSDDQIVQMLDGFARELGLPTVITQDAHYCLAEEKPLHETLKRLVTWSDDESEAVFPGDSFHLANAGWVQDHYAPDVWSRGVEGLEDLLGKHDLAIPELEKYHYNVPVVTAGDPQKELEGLCSDALNDLGGRSEFIHLLDEEMDVIEYTRMASYLLLVKEVTDWCRQNGVFFQARGSASGSLICYLLGITQLNPLEWNLRYERFLSKDRTKPPDIDLDVEDARRDDLMAMLRARFNVCQIGTYATYSVTVEEGRGSLLVSYISRKRKSGQKVDHIKTVFDLPPEDQQALFALSKREAKKSAGTHAAGLVVTSTRDELERLVPTMLIPSSETTVTQYEMDDVEALGLVKLDVLGLKQLRTIRRTVELLGKSVYDGLDWIPVKDRKTFMMLRRGYCDGVFQLEGFTNRKGCQEMRVKTIDDLVVLVALYRPATMNTGVKDTYIQRRAGWDQAPKRHQILERHLKETHGVPVFQEQVIAILRDLGFSPDELTEFLKAVKASNKNIGNAGEVIQRYEQIFLERAFNHEWADSDTRFAWQAIEGFAEYGFNRAHAAQYGLTAYRSAYLKANHPLEFMSALLEVWAGTPKEQQYVLAAKEAGVKLLKPDVNVSGFSWTLDTNLNAVRKGLLSIKGVGEKAALEISSKAPYSDMDDLIARCDARAVNGGKSWSNDGSLKGVLEKLRSAGALTSLGVK